MVRHSHGLWHVDDVAALMALVKGRSKVDPLDQMAEAAHLGAFALRAQAYYEYVESHTNWSDEISRLGIEGSWAAHNDLGKQHCGVTCIG